MTNRATRRCGRRRLVFVVGAGRSGTTLLTHILHRHPDMSATPETHFLRHVHEFRGGPRAFVRAWPESAQWLCHRLGELDGPSWRPAAERLVAAVGRDLGRRVIPALRRLFLAVIEDATPILDRPVLVEKTPQHMEYVQLIRRLFPEAAIIHIVRDGRAVASSLARMKWWGRGLAGAMAYWAEWVPRTSAWVRRDPNSLEVRYELLARAPERVLEEVTRFLGVHYTPAMLEPTVEEKALVEREGDHKAGAMRPVDPGAVEQWRDRVDETTTRYMEVVMGEALSALGYLTGQSVVAQPRFLIGGSGGNGVAWSVAENLIREYTEGLVVGEVWVRRLSRDFCPQVPTVACEDFALTVLNAASRLAGMRAAAMTAINVSRLGRRLRWVRAHTGTPRWRRRRMLEGWIAARAEVVPAKTF